ncbi:ABC-F family ATP-binding cassette domain-containing protein [Lutimonas zeaxanthinifaciens]|uniref:ABC-F family ATP-binding cassette domain-containing protein n=1 Tax=Lutimonas zeaxanthinifaciens TaxID=3060215 RepID=UPI00265D2F19|nr:ABC-F family ATP-binding cassette domain-containing protein [Lutimonas sp. YSD2104]WKK66066.1 ABC-F family ATP-binding cassette domain-containing protein [Lutimonas sp. YSD2104]
MNYLSVEQISKSFGDRILFEDLSFGINKDQKIGFVAKNGTGKTTLLKIISGEDSPDKGQIILRNGLKVGYLSQKENLNEQLSVEESIFNADNTVLKIIQEYEKALKNPEDEQAYQKAFDLMEQNNAWDFETQYKQILFKLKLEDLDKKVSSLSGGQKKRLALAIILLDQPELLILDEPTNHLDLEMIEWLEQYLKKTNTTLFMVTHDRYFLDRVCNEILELDQGSLYRYKGNYSYFLEKKEERITAEQSTISKAKNLFKKELEWMRRQPKARTTKSKSRIDDFHEIKKIAHQRRKDHQVQLEIQMERLGSKVVELHHISKSFDDKLLIDKFDYVFKRGERIGIIGKNGTGKSTFVNMITGSLKPDSGKIVIGDTIKFGYYSQSGIRINPGQKVIEVIREFGDYIPLAKGRTISAGQLLERFLFDRKKQYDYVEKLSGGELKRLFLCTVLIQNPNFLILDEPTNDLDILTLQVLENFLLDFPGNLVVISHDRYFMDRIVDHLFVFEGNSTITDFPGNYSDYRIYEDSKPSEGGEKIKKQDSRKAEPKAGQLSYTEKKEFSRLEKDISNLERKKKEIEGMFSNNEIDPDQIQESSLKLQEIIQSLEEKEERWFELSMKMEL